MSFSIRARLREIRAANCPAPRNVSLSLLLSKLPKKNSLNPSHSLEYKTAPFNPDAPFLSLVFSLALRPPTFIDDV